MSFARKTAFGTSYGHLTDEERQNAQLGMWNTDRQDRLQGRDAAANIALRELQERARMFDAARGDQRADRQSMTDLTKAGWDRSDAREDRNFAREDANFGKQFDYMAGRDQRQDAFQNKQLDYSKGSADKHFAREDSRYAADRQDMIDQRTEARNDKLGGLRETIAFQYLKSNNPQLRALGAQMAAKIPTFEGIDFGLIGGALAPQITPAQAMADRPSIGLGIRDASARVNDAWGPQGALVQQAQFDAAIKQLADRGVPLEEAQAFVREQMDQSIAAPSFWSHPISSTIDALLPGTPVTSNLSDRGQKRSALGLRPQSR